MVKKIIVPECRKPEPHEIDVANVLIDNKFTEIIEFLK